MVLFFIMMILVAPANSEHDIQVSIFTIHNKSSVLMLDVHVNKTDLSEELTIPVEDLTTLSLQQYLNENTAFIFDGQRSLLEIQSIESEGEHLMIQSKFAGDVEQVGIMEISNICLLSIEDQSNIIEIRVNDVERDFLMNRSRTTINVEL